MNIRLDVNTAFAWISTIIIVMVVADKDGVLLLILVGMLGALVGYGVDKHGVPAISKRRDRSSINYKEPG